jgi:aminopeptidase
MLTEQEMEKYCDVLLWALATARKGKYRKGNVILVRYDLAAIRMAEILQSRLLGMGMNQSFDRNDRMESDFSGGRGKWLVYLPRGREAL